MKGYVVAVIVENQTNVTTEQNRFQSKTNNNADVALAYVHLFVLDSNKRSTFPWPPVRIHKATSYCPGVEICFMHGALIVMGYAKRKDQASSSINLWTSGPFRRMRLPSSSGGFPSRTAPKSRICKNELVGMH